jgi:hypothetical protein
MFGITQRPWLAIGLYAGFYANLGTAATLPGWHAKWESEQMRFPDRRYRLSGCLDMNRWQPGYNRFTGNSRGST